MPAVPAETNELFKWVIAFIGGGVINTSVLAYIFFRMVSIDRQLAEVKVHLAYLRRDVAYNAGLDIDEPEGPK